MSDACTTWFQNRWGEESPLGSPPQYTDTNLQEAYNVGTLAPASAINDQLAKARQTNADSSAKRADKERAQAVEATLLEVAKAAGLPPYEGPSGAWVDDEAVKR